MIPQRKTSRSPMKLAALLGGVVVVALLALQEPAAAGGLRFSKKDLKSESSVWRLYDLWVKHYNLQRKPAERMRRFAAFNSTAHRLASRRVAGQTSPALNIFADVTDQEFTRRYMCSIMQAPPNLIAPPMKRRGRKSIPFSFSWRNETCGDGQPCLSPVKYQGGCGACWAFAATGALESNYVIKNGGMLLLSEQELVSCVGRSDRCEGGNAIFAFDYVRRYGLAPSTAYPYRGVNGTCHSSTTRRANFTLLGVETVGLRDYFDEFSLLSAVIDGPLVVSVAFGNESDNDFREYYGGIYQGKCGTSITHQMLLVGYDRDSYILKNSWGQEWGDDGYLLLSRDVGCGILNTSSYYPLMG